VFSEKGVLWSILGLFASFGLNNSAPSRVVFYLGRYNFYQEGLLGQYFTLIFAEKYYP
jgi:hypothetical protein